MSDKKLMLEILEIQKTWDYLYSNGDMEIEILVYYYPEMTLDGKIDYDILHKMIHVELYHKKKIVFCEQFSNASQFDYWIEGINMVLPRRLKKKYFKKYLKEIWRS